MSALHRFLRGGWRSLGRSILDLAYPPVCFGCQSLLPPSWERPDRGVQQWLCTTCIENLPAIEAPLCALCGEPYDGALSPEFVCWNCSGRELAFDFAVSGYRAEGLVRHLIHDFKYGRRYELRGLLGALLARALLDPRLQSEDLQKWLLVPVPLDFLREFRREFNQSWEISLELSRLSGIPAAKILRRVRRTRNQASLDRTARLSNLRGAFSLRQSWLGGRALPELAGKTVLLVDDVLTTGSTTHECARILKRHGKAQKVVVITIGRG